jgi:DNA-binding beta-propeller fold protein YncE
VGTADGRWAFALLSVSDRGEIAVLALGHGTPHLVRTVRLPRSFPSADGMALTHDGRLLLVAAYTRTAVVSVRALEDGRGDPVAGVLTDAGAGQFEVAVSGDDRYVYVTDETTGGLSVFDLAVALRHGFTARGVAVGIVPLAHGAVGVTLSPGGTLVYVTTLGADGPHGRALRAVVRVGSEPGRGPQAVSVIDTAAALAHRPALAGAVQAGAFPRDLNADPADGRVLLANFFSGTVEEFTVPRAG